MARITDARRIGARHPRLVEPINSIDLAKRPSCLGPKFKFPTCCEFLSSPLWRLHVYPRSRILVSSLTFPESLIFNRSLRLSPLHDCTWHDFYYLFLFEIKRRSNETINRGISASWKIYYILVKKKRGN